MDIARNVYLNLWSMLHGLYLRVFIQIYLLLEAFGFEALFITSYGPFATIRDSDERNVLWISTFISFLSLSVINILWHIHQTDN